MTHRHAAAVVVAAALLGSCGFSGSQQAATLRTGVAADSVAGDSADAARSESSLSLRPDEVHTIHAPFGIPAGSNPTNDLIFRHSYTASTNDETKFAEWVAYEVTAEWSDGTSDPARRYKTDPFLKPDETLEEISDRGDYAGAYAAVGYDRGHLVPLASFRESPFVQEVNYLSVLAPQVAGLNHGPWRSIELAVRGLAAALGGVYVIAGPVYDSSTPMPALPGADEPHVVPTGYWMIIYTGEEMPRVCAFNVPQLLLADHDPERFATSLDAIEAATGLDFLSLLDDEVEPKVEEATAMDWYLS